MIELPFSSDQFFASGLIGSVEGVCGYCPVTGCVCLLSVDWDRSVFCRDGCETGEPVDPTPAERHWIEESIDDALSSVCDAQFMSRVILRQESVPAL